MSDVFTKITEELIAGNIEDVPKLCLNAEKAGTAPQEILDKSLFPGMESRGTTNENR